LNRKNPSSRRNKREPQSYLRYTGLAFELLAFNLVLIWGGYEMDEYVENAVPWFLILGAFIAAFGTVYYLILRTK